MKKIDEHVSILGIPVFSGGFNGALAKIEAILEDPGKKMLLVLTPNPEQIVISRENEAFKKALIEADLAIPDGVGMGYAAFFLAGKRVERIAGIDLAEALVRVVVARGEHVMLMGGSEESAERAVENLKFKTQNSKVILDSNEQGVGRLIVRDGGAQDITRETDEERERVLQHVRDFKPALLLVAYGAPWQELWVSRNREELEQAGVKVVMVVGGAFDVWAQKVRRAPLQWRKNGLEWLWRLIQQPWRWRRQLRLIKFVGLVMGDWIRK